MAQKKRANKPIQIALTEDQIANIIREAARTRRGLKAESLEERIAPSRFGLPVFGGAEAGLPGAEDPLPGSEDPIPGADDPLPGTSGEGTPGTVDGDPTLPDDPFNPSNDPFVPQDPNAPIDPNDPGGALNPYDPNYLDPQNPPLPDENEVFDPSLPPGPEGEFAPDDPAAPWNQPGYSEVPLPEGEIPQEGEVPPLPPGSEEGALQPDDPVLQNFNDQVERELHESLQERLESGGDPPSPEELEEHRQNIIRQLRGE